MKKNILFLFSDQHRGDWMPYDEETRRSCGYSSVPLKMPNIHALMSEGATFTGAVTNSPLCVPARACLATGAPYEACGAPNNDFCCPTDRPTFYRDLKNAGYTVAGVGKFDLHKPVMYWGEQGWIPELSQLGFTRARENEGKGDANWALAHGCPGPYGRLLKEQGLAAYYMADHRARSDDQTISAPSTLPDRYYADNWVTEQAEKELREVSSGADPWFLMVNFSGPHDPWDSTVAMLEQTKETDYPLPPTYTGDPALLQGVRRNYAAMLENLDRCMGRLLDRLRVTGQYENTVIIYASDHGEMLGDHDRYHKSVPYEGAVRIPLVITGGDARRGAVCRSLVQLSDLAATILDYAEVPGTIHGDSRSLRPAAASADAPPVRTWVCSALDRTLQSDGRDRAAYGDYERYFKNAPRGADRWRCVITERYKYIERDGCPAELCDLQADPAEMNNLIDDPEHGDILSWLREGPAAAMAESGDPTAPRTAG